MEGSKTLLRANSNHTHAGSLHGGGSPLHLFVRNPPPNPWQLPLEKSLGHSRCIANRSSKLEGAPHLVCPSFPGKPPLNLICWRVMSKCWGVNHFEFFFFFLCSLPFYSLSNACPTAQLGGWLSAGAWSAPRGSWRGMVWISAPSLARSGWPTAASSRSFRGAAFAPGAFLVQGAFGRRGKPRETNIWGCFLEMERFFQGKQGFMVFGGFLEMGRLALDGKQSVYESHSNQKSGR